MKKTICLLLLLTVALLCSCGESDPAESYYHTGDLLACIDWNGKTPEEAGIPNRYVQDDALPCILFDGTLFGKLASGSAFLTAQGRIHLTYIKCRLLDYETCRQELTALYGEAADDANSAASSGESRCVFYTGDCRIELSQANVSAPVLLTVSLQSDENAGQG